MRLWWGLADRSNRQSQAVEGAARAAIAGVAMGVACKQAKRPWSKQARGLLSTRGALSASSPGQ